MAASGACLKKWQEFTFSSATTPPTLSACQQIVVDPGVDSPNTSSIGDQLLLVTATMSDNAATGTIIFLWADEDSVSSAGAGFFHYRTAALAATAYRQAHAGNGGDYIASVDFTNTTANTSYAVLDIAGIGSGGRFPKLYVGCTVRSAGTITVRVCPIRNT